MCPLSCCHLLNLQEEQQQQQQPEAWQQQQQQPKFQRCQRKAAASTQVQIPGLPLTLPKLLVPSSVANATRESLWGSVLITFISAAAVLSTIKGILGGGKRPDQEQQQDEVVTAEALAAESTR